MSNIKDKVKKYLVENVKKDIVTKNKKRIKENVTGGNVAPAASNAVTSGGTGEAHQGGKKIKVKKNFKENFKEQFKKVVASNPKFVRKPIKETSFKIPVEKLVGWASKNVLYASSSPYAAIQQYADENNTTVENIRKMAKFYLSNSQMFGKNVNDYADVLKDLIATIDEVTWDNDPSKGSVPKSSNLNEMRYSQFTKQASIRSPRETLHKAIREIGKKIKEAKKAMDFTSKMKTEFKDKYSVQYMERTNKALHSLQKDLTELYKAYKQIK